MLESDDKKGMLQGMGFQHRRECRLPSATYFLLVQKVGKNTLKEENPFDWVFSLKNLYFLNGQRGCGPFGNPELWRGGGRGYLLSREAARHSIASLAVHRAWSFVGSPVRGRVARR